MRWTTLAGVPAFAQQGSCRACCGALLRSVRRLVWAWFDEHDKLVDPPRLLSGRELMTTLVVATAPRVRQLLEVLREAQAQVPVRTREQAIDYLRLHVTRPRKNEGNPHRRV